MDAARADVVASLKEKLVREIQTRHQQRQLEDGKGLSKSQCEDFVKAQFVEYMKPMSQLEQDRPDAVATGIVVHSLHDSGSIQIGNISIHCSTNWLYLS